MKCRHNSKFENGNKLKKIVHEGFFFVYAIHGYCVLSLYCYIFFSYTMSCLIEDKSNKKVKK